MTTAIRSGPPMAERSLRIIEMAAGPDGVDRARVEASFGISDKTASAMLSELARRGHLHRGRVARLPLRFFADAAAARHWEAKQASPSWQLNLARTNNITPKRPAPAPVPAPTERTKVTVGIACGHDPRYQCSPDERPFGAGFAAVGIGRDVRTGMGW